MGRKIFDQISRGGGGGGEGKGTGIYRGKSEMILWSSTVSTLHRRDMKGDALHNMTDSFTKSRLGKK